MLSRVVDDLEKVTTVFPSDLVLRGGDKIRVRTSDQFTFTCSYYHVTLQRIYLKFISKVWARGMKPLNASALDIEANIKSWGMGANASTKLTNMAGDVGVTSDIQEIYHLSLSHVK